MIDALIGFAVLFALLFFGVPIAFGLGVVGFVGFWSVVGLGPTGAMAANIAWDTLTNYGLSVLPLFILMGNLVNQAGLSRELYEASYAFVGHRRGGLAMATIMACGGFSAVSGSSLATAATMSTIALPPMRRFGYSEALATGSVAAGGTLGILIPPSVILVIYGSLTETDIGALFIAGILPGLLGVVLYLISVMVVTRIDPKAGPAGERVDWPARWRALSRVWGVLVLFMVVIGGIYLGVFTPTEAAGIGATGAFLFALGRRTLSFRKLFAILMDTARTSALLMFVLVGALIFSNFINITGLPFHIVDAVEAAALDPLTVVFLLLLVYLILGCVFDSLAMILLTVPVFFPLVTGLDLDLFGEDAAIWFGILVVVAVEISLITPPIGMNIFVIRTVLRDVPVTTIFRGVVPFIAVDLIRLALIVFVPWIALVLPHQMG
jgi:tripartite ATP-independent transporter DctM subunit